MGAGQVQRTCANAYRHRPPADRNTGPVYVFQRAGGIEPGLALDSVGFLSDETGPVSSFARPESTEGATHAPVLCI